MNKKLKEEKPTTRQNLRSRPIEAATIYELILGSSKKTEKVKNK